MTQSSETDNRLSSVPSVYHMSSCNRSGIFTLEGIREYLEDPENRGPWILVYPSVLNSMESPKYLNELFFCIEHDMIRIHSSPEDIMVTFDELEQVILNHDYNDYSEDRLRYYNAIKDRSRDMIYDIIVNEIVGASQRGVINFPQYGVPVYASEESD